MAAPELLLVQVVNGSVYPFFKMVSASFLVVMLLGLHVQIVLILV